MVVPENRKHPLKLRMTMQFFRVAVVLFALVFIVFIVGVVMGGKYIKLYVEYKTLMAQNQNLRNQLEKVREIEARLERMEEIESFLYYLISEDKEKPTERQNIPTTDFLSSNLDTPEKRYRFIPAGLPQNGFISSGYGDRGRMYDDEHRGVDIALPPGKPVFSTGAGRVVFSGYDNELGLSVSIDHLNGYMTKYGHLSRLNVEAGAVIDKNYIIGFSGKTGKSIGTHIHYVVLKNGEVVPPLSENHKQDSLDLPSQ